MTHSNVLSVGRCTNFSNGSPAKPIAVLSWGMLTSGIGVMLGSEIGTTLIAQLIAFKIGHFYLPVIAIGFILAEVFH